MNRTAGGLEDLATGAFEDRATQSAFRRQWQSQEGSVGAVLENERD